MTATTVERYAATRTIPAAPADVFAVLADPARHEDTERRLDESGAHRPGGWWWRYDLAPNGSSTDVTLTYDWSGTDQGFRDTVGVPVFEADVIERSLATLERTVG